MGEGPELTRVLCAPQVGGLLDSKGYGIAMKKSKYHIPSAAVRICIGRITFSRSTDSTYRQAMNLALLNLQEAGILREMKRSWWIEKHGGGACKVTIRTYRFGSFRSGRRLMMFLVVARTRIRTRARS